MPCPLLTYHHPGDQRLANKAIIAAKRALNFSVAKTVPEGTKLNKGEKKAMAEGEAQSPNNAPVALDGAAAIAEGAPPSAEVKKRRLSSLPPLPSLPLPLPHDDLRLGTQPPAPMTLGGVDIGAGKAAIPAGSFAGAVSLMDLPAKLGQGVMLQGDSKTQAGGRGGNKGGRPGKDTTAGSMAGSAPPSAGAKRKASANSAAHPSLLSLPGLQPIAAPAGSEFTALMGGKISFGGGLLPGSLVGAADDLSSSSPPQERAMMTKGGGSVDEVIGQALAMLRGASGDHQKGGGGALEDDDE